MADFYAPDYNAKPLHMNEAGNAWAENYSITAKPEDGDKLYFGIIPAGVEVDLVRATNGAAGTNATLDLGFEPVHDAPDADTDHWFAAADVATAGSAFSTVKPIRFERPVRLVGVAGGANYTNSIRIDVNVKGIAIGAK